MQILIADDDATVRLLLKATLKKWGYDVIEAKDGKAALDILTGKNPPRIALLDWMMPEKNGVEIVKTITENSLAPLIYTILITSRSEKNDIVLALDSGAHDFISKPVYPEELRSRIAVGKRLIEADKKLETQLLFQKALMDAVPTPIFVYDNECRLIEYNRFFQKTLGPPFNQLNENNIKNILIKDPDFSENGCRFSETVKDAVHQYETKIVLNDGITHDVIIHNAKFKSPKGEIIGTIGAVMDITERKALEEELKCLANFDSLTGLMNRRYFFEISDKEFKKSKRYNRPFSFIMLDIDHFKNINDGLGHQAGDFVLSKISKHMLDQVRQSDHVGRIGGEEFAILLPETNIDKAVDFSERIRHSIANLSITFADRTFNITVSIGVSSYSENDPSMEIIMSRADKALYQSKNNGRNRVCHH